LSKKIAIVQSSYIPWKGYFDIINSVDEFVVYDTAGYSKNSWRNRNRIPGPNGLQWLTIPVKVDYLNQPVNEIRIHDFRWAARHWKTLKAIYGKAPYFRLFAPSLTDLYEDNATEPYLSAVNVRFLHFICRQLNISTPLSFAQDLTAIDDPTEKLLHICRSRKATHYLTGPAARDYLRLSRFEEENITVEWMNYEGYPEYPRQSSSFSHYVSILDLLFRTGPDASMFMKSFSNP